MKSLKYICDLFQLIAESTWIEIAKNNNRGNPLDERGITTGIVISRIQDFIQQSGTRNIFAQVAKNESTRGGDIEIYLEHSDNKYVRFLLQAKVLKLDGTYHDVNHKVQSTNKFQWDLLNAYSKIAQCIPKYLFYNGIMNYSWFGLDCRGNFNERQYGCSIADVSEVKKYCNSNGRLQFIQTASQSPFGNPWRCIPCCLKNWSLTNDEYTLKFYSRDEIDMDTSFEEIFRIPYIGLVSTYIPQKTTVERINEELFTKGWLPNGRILISNSGINPGTTILVSAG